MTRIFGILFRETIFLQALLALVHLKDCGLQKYSVVTAKSGDDVVIVSDPYTPEHPFLHRIDFRLDSTGRYRSVATFVVYEFGKVFIRYTAPNVSVEVHLLGPHYEIQNITLKMLNVSEADSGVYTLYDESFEQTLNCWTLYVFGSGKYDTSRDYIEEGTFFNVTDFSHLSEEVVQRLNASISWQIEDQVISHQSEYTLNITRNMNNKSLTYTVEGQNHNTLSVSYRLNVSYTGPIVLEPNRTPYTYTLSLNETLRSITCLAACNPTCNITWKSENVTVSDNNVLGPGVIMLRTAEYICHVTNRETGEHLNESIDIYFAEKELVKSEQEQGEESLVYVFATLMTVFVLTTAVLTILLCRQNLCSFSKHWFLRRASNTDTVEMEADNVVARTTVDIAYRTNATYDDLQNRDGQEKVYDVICNQKQPSGERNKTYENVF